MFGYPVLAAMALVAMAVTGAAAWGAPVPASTDAPAAASDATNALNPGHQLVEQRCARCHSIAKTGASPYPGAQPFRNLERRWTRDQLAQALRTGILAEHDKSGVRFEMRLSDQEIADFFDFLDSIATRRHPAPRAS
jgi:mono/diheme cytochrome c family protein